MHIAELSDPVSLPGENLFSCERWLTVFRQEYGFSYQAVVGSDGAEERPLLVFSIIDDIYGKRIISLPFSDYTELGVPAETMCQAVLFVRNTYPDLPFTIKPCAELGQLLAAGFSVTRRAFCHRIPLGGTIEGIWDRTSHAFKKGVKKAERHGIRFATNNSPEGVDDFFRLLVKLRREKFHILPQPRSFYLSLFHNFVATGGGDICFALKGDRPVASAFILKSGNAIYDKMGVSDQEFLDLRPNNLLLWEVMKQGNADGRKFLDMGLTQSDKEGLLRFKESLGSTSMPITYYRYLPADYDDSAEQHIKSLISRLTGFIIKTATSDSQIEGASEILYRYFC